jgi:hypothetical protein
VATKVIVKQSTGPPGIADLQEENSNQNKRPEKQKAGRLGPALRTEKLSIAELS